MFKTLLAIIALLAGSVVQAQSIDGGLTWNGWTDRGMSNQLGVGSGAADEVYRVYSTFFYFDNQSRTNTGEIGGGPTRGYHRFRHRQLFRRRLCQRQRYSGNRFAGHQRRPDRRLDLRQVRSR